MPERAALVTASRTPPRPMCNQGHGRVQLGVMTGEVVLGLGGLGVAAPAGMARLSDPANRIIRCMRRDERPDNSPAHSRLTTGLPTDPPRGLSGNEAPALDGVVAA